MERLRDLWRRLVNWLTTHWWAILKWLILLGLLLAVLAGASYLFYNIFAFGWPIKSGLDEFVPPQPKLEGYERAKTLWDWLGLLLIPLMLAIGGVLFTWSENRSARHLQKQSEAEARRVETERAQDAALQAYLDQMTQLLLHEKLRTPQADDEVRSVARARTLTVLRVLDGVRKATVLQFLYEANLIGGIKEKEGEEYGTFDAIVSLEGARLEGAYLEGAYLERAYLEWAHLERAHLLGANLKRAHLLGANLEGANLQEAYLGGTYLGGANLTGARLFKAYLIRANLGGANLTGADLSGADLTNSNITREQLAQAKSSKGAKLPFDMTPPPAPEAKEAAPQIRQRQSPASEVEVAAPQNGQSQPKTAQHIDTEHE